MTIPAVSSAKIKEAMTRFDAEVRSSPQWANWEDNRAHQYAIAAGDELYPVKQIIAMATGAAPSSFGGGSEANNYLRDRDFDIVRLREGEQSGAFLL